MSTFLIDLNDGKGETPIDVPAEFSSTPEVAESWANTFYAPYRDSGMEAADTDPGHPLSGIPDWVGRGFYRLAQGANMIQLRLGLDDPENVAKDISDYQGYIKKLPYDEDSLNFLLGVRDANDEKDFWKSMGLYWDAVAAKGGLGALTEISFESLAQISPVLAAAGTTYKKYGAGAGMLAFGLGSFLIEFGSQALGSVDEYLREFEDTDITDTKALANVFSDETKMKGFTDFALKRGLPIAVIDAMSIGVAGRFTSAVTNATRLAKTAAFAGKKLPLETAQKVYGAKGRLSRLAPRAGAMAAESLVLQPAMGGFGEYAAQVATGEERKWGDIFTEAGAEIIPGTAETMLGAAILNREARQEIAREYFDQTNVHVPIASSSLLNTLSEDKTSSEEVVVADILTDPNAEKALIEHIINFNGSPSVLENSPITMDSITKALNLNSNKSPQLILSRLENLDLVQTTPDGLVYTKRAQNIFNATASDKISDDPSTISYVIVRGSPKSGYSPVTLENEEHRLASKKDASLLQSRLKRAEQDSNIKYKVQPVRFNESIDPKTGKPVGVDSVKEFLLKNVSDDTSINGWQLLPEKDDNGNIILDRDVIMAGLEITSFDEGTTKHYKRGASTNTVLNEAVIEDNPDNPELKGLKDEEESFDVTMGIHTVKIDKSIANRLAEVAQEQRGDSEVAMLEVTHINSGALNPVVERAGDIFHRMAKDLKYGETASIDVLSKLNTVITALESKYGFIKEHNENLKETASFNGISIEEHTANVDASLAKLAEANRKLVALNRPQELAKEIAVAVSEKRFSDALTTAQTLRDLIENNPQLYLYELTSIVEEEVAPIVEEEVQPPVQEPVAVEQHFEPQPFGVDEEIIKFRNEPQENLEDIITAQKAERIVNEENKERTKDESLKTPLGSLFNDDFFNDILNGGSNDGGGNDPFTGGPPSGENIEAAREELKNVSTEKMLTGISKLFAYIQHPTTVVELFPESKKIYQAIILGRRATREKINSKLMTPLHNFFNNLTPETRFQIMKLRLVLEALSPFNSENYNYLRIVETGDGSISITIPDAPALEANRDGPVIDENGSTTQVYSNEFYNKLLTSLEVVPGEVLTLSPQDAGNFWKVHTSFKEAYEIALSSFVVQLIEQNNPLYGNLTWEKQDTLASYMTKILRSSKGYLNDISNNRFELDEAINEVIRKKINIEEFYKDENNNVHDESIRAINNSEEFFGQLDELLIQLEEITESGSIPTKNMMMALDRISAKMIGVFETLGNQTVTDKIRTQLRRATAQLNIIRLIQDSSRKRESNPFYVPHQRKGDNFFFIKDLETGKIVYDETSPKTMLDSVFKIGLKQLKERRKLKKLEYPAPRYKVSPIKPVTPQSTKRQLSREDIPLLERMAVTLGYKDSKLIEEFIEETAQEIYGTSMNKHLRPREAGKFGRRESILGHITPTNYHNYGGSQLGSYMRSTADMGSNMLYHQIIQDEITMLEEINPELANYWKKQLEYMNDPRDYGGMLKSLAFHGAIGLNFSSAMVNASQSFMTTIPLLKTIIGFNNEKGATSAVFKALQDAYYISDPTKAGLDRYGFNFTSIKVPDRLKGRITQDEWKMLRELYNEGIIQAIMNIEMGSNITENFRQIEERFGFGGKGNFGRTASKAMETSAFMFGYVEQINRITAALAAYRLAKKSPEMLNKFKNFSKHTMFADSKMTPYQAARMLVIKSQFMIGKENKPLLFHNLIGNVASQFLSFVLQYAGLWAQSARIMFGTTGKRAAGKTPEELASDQRAASILVGGLVVTTFITGGLMGAPGAENLRQLLRTLTKDTKLMGIDLEFGVREAVVEWGFGGAMVDIITRGPLSYLIGVDVSKRMTASQVVPFDLMNNDLTVATGAFGGIVYDSFKRATSAFSETELDGWGKPSLRFLSAFFPMGVRNAIDATISVFDPTEPIRTTQGRVVMPSKEIGLKENLARFLGFTPYSLRQKRLQKQYIKYVEGRAEGVKNYYYTQIAKVTARRIKERKEGNLEAVQNYTEILQSILEDINEHNRDAIARRHPEDIVKTKNNVIRDRVRVEIHGTSSRKGVKKAVRHLVNDLGMYTHGLLK